MDHLLTPETRAFRDEVRTFLNERLPADLSRAARRATSVFLHPDVTLAWQRILHAQGWVAPDWPVEHGGPGWDGIRRYIFAEESARAHAPSLPPQGLKMVAPVIMYYGSDEQKATLLPRILSGDDYWCQGYSEPGAGSDLAALRMRAVRDGDDYVLNGSKIWTTHAHFANRMFCLVRTSTEGRPQSGITFLLLEMATLGITVAPILTLAGDHELNQVFFDDARVPVAGRLGAENDGWTVAKHLLTFERGGRYAPHLAAFHSSLHEAAERIGWLEHAGNRERLAREAIAIDALRAIEVAALEGSGPADAVRPSMLKVLGTEASQRLDHLALEMAATWEGAIEDAPDAIAVALPRYLNNRAGSIYAGSNEIQRDLIARVVVDQAA
ncbi:MAG: acyl-CoA dehydrogenase family protein [Candidatus Sphingomonas colombiensis]|nr:acyl-CoA dehydrogenase family protein [Sphingomonas sp.]WEK42446.1 MAG: acyl-CoA dehydrogenase family protein [Sphingomonas sp.]